MPFRPKKKPPQFADLKGILAQTKDTENPAYQTIQLIIERLDQTKDVTQDQIAVIEAEISQILKSIAPKTASYHTKNDETAQLPNSVQLLAGSGIVFDDTVPNKRTIISTGGGHYDCPLSDGDLIEANLIYASGACIIVQVPV
jgi:hypothetical protein